MIRYNGGHCAYTCNYGIKEEILTAAAQQGMRLREAPPKKVAGKVDFLYSKSWSTIYVRRFVKAMSGLP